MLDNENKKNAFIRIQVTADDKQIIFDKAKEERLSVSALIRKALKQYLEGHKNGV